MKIRVSFFKVEKNRISGKVLTCLKLILFSSILAYFCSLLFVSLINCSNPSESVEKELQEPISKDWFINAFFDKLNRRDSTLSLDEKEVNDILVIGIDPVVSDSDFVKILGKIGDIEARCTVLDITFSHKNSKNDSLEHVLKRLDMKQNLIIASWYDNQSKQVKQSYFNIDHTFKSGIANYSDILDLKNEYKGHTTLATKIAQSLNVDCEVGKHQIINYRIKDINESIISSLNEVDDLRDTYPDISNKILIIGSLDPSIDKKNLPFSLDRINQEQGCVLIAYELCSLMNIKSGDKYKTPLNKMSYVCDFFFCILILFIYLVILKIPIVLIENIQTTFLGQICGIVKKVKVKMCSRKAIWILNLVGLIFFKVAVLTGVEIFVINMAFVWTEFTLLVPDIFLFVVSLLFVEEIYNKLNNCLIK